MVFIKFIFAHLVGVMTPGPGFILVAENAIIYGWKYGIISSIGLNFAYIIHLLFIVLNFNNNFTNNNIYNIFNFISGLFLLYLAYKTVSNKGIKKLAKIHNVNKIKTNIKWQMIAIESFIIGFFNAKGFALLTFLLKTFAVQNNVIYYAMWTPCALIFYHSLMIYCMTRSQIRLQFIKNIEYFSKIFALLLIFFAIKIFTQIHINI